jgi:hypothetical protein
MYNQLTLGISKKIIKNFQNIVNFLLLFWISNSIS